MSIIDKIESITISRNAIRTKMVSAGQATRNDKLATLASNLEIVNTSDATATAEDIREGKTAYVEGTKITGTSTKDADTSDATATASDIAQGKTAYVEGTKITGTSTKDADTSDATATASDILTGKTAYSNGVKLTGTITSKSAQTYTPGTTDQTITAGQYLSGAQTISGDADLVASNIKKDVSIFGVTGTYQGTDTSDATATAEDIREGKTAYVNGVKITGTAIIPVPVRTMTAKFDLTNSNPDTWGTYYDDAVGMTVGDDAWDEFFGHYPCILDNGVELGKLKRTDFSQYEDGTSAPITTLGKDVMIAYPKRGIKLSINNNILTVSMTNAEGVEGYSYLAHSYKGDPCDKFYLGAYKGYSSSNKLYSVSGQTPTTNQTIGTFRTQAQARGTGYEQSAFFQLTYRQVMYMLKYLGKNAQIAVGRGLANGSAVYGNVGYTNDKGMDWGESTGKYPMKLFGLEDFYGNIFECIDGIYSNSSRQYLVSDGNFNDTGSGYTNAGTATFSSNVNCWLKLPNGTNLAGFTPSSNTSGSKTTYFCDYVDLYAGLLAGFGGFWNAGDGAGVFRLAMLISASDSYATYGGRLMYMKTA